MELFIKHDLSSSWTPACYVICHEGWGLMQGTVLSNATLNPFLTLVSWCATLHYTHSVINLMCFVSKHVFDVLTLSCVFMHHRLISQEWVQNYTVIYSPAMLFIVLNVIFNALFLVHCRIYSYERSVESLKIEHKAKGQGRYF